MNDDQPSIWSVLVVASRIALTGTFLAIAVASCGVRSVGGTAKHKPAPVEPDQPSDDRSPVVPQEFRNDTSKRVDKAFADYRAGMARGWRDAATQQPPAQSWDEAYSRVKRNNFAEREKAFAPFAQDLDRLTQGKQFTPELFREIAETVAKELEVAP